MTSIGLCRNLRNILISLRFNITKMMNLRTIICHNANTLLVQIVHSVGGCMARKDNENDRVIISPVNEVGQKLRVLGENNL